MWLIWGTRLCQALFCRDGWIQREFCLVLMELLNNELANFHSRLINAPIKANIVWISNHIKERKTLRKSKEQLISVEGPLRQSFSLVSVLQDRPAHLPQQSILQLVDQEQLLAPSARQQQHHNHFRAF